MRRPARSLPDTNVIVRYLVGDHEALHARAKDFFDGVRDGTEKAVITESVVAECVYVLTMIYKVPREKVAASFVDILHYKGIANDDRNSLIRALNLFFHHNLGIVDCILAAKGLESGGRLFSFDEELNRVARHA